MEEGDSKSPETPLAQLKWAKYTARIKSTFASCTSDNLDTSIVSLFRSYLNWTWAVFCRECFSVSCGTFDNTQMCAAILAIVNSKISDVGLSTVKYVLYRLLNGLKTNQTSEVEKSAIFLGECYRNQVIDSNLIVEVIMTLLERGRSHLSVILKLLWNVAPVLHIDDTTSLSLIFQTLFRYSEDKTYAEEIQNLTRWRQNKWQFIQKNGKKIKYTRIPKRYDILEGEFETHEGLSLDDAPSADNTADFVAPYGLDSFEQLRSDYKQFLAEVIPDDEEEEEEERAEADSARATTVEPSEIKDIEKSLEESKRLEKEREFQRQTYMHIVSSATAGEAAHKLLKIQKETRGAYDETIISTCVNYIGLEKTFNRNLGLMMQFMCNASEKNKKLVESCFSESYTQCHKYSTYRITNLACLYAYLLATDSVSWSVLAAIRLTEEDTTSAQRVFIRFLMEEIAKAMSYTGLVRRLSDPDVAGWTSGILLTDTLEHAEFVVLFFTHIRLDFILERVNAEVLRMTEERSQQRAGELGLLPAGSESESAPEEPQSDSSDSDAIPIDDADTAHRRHHHRHRHRH